MNNDIMVSVIVPIYNAGKYLGELLQSIKEQTYQNYEVILVNDGSTDNSSEICKQFCSNNEYVKYYEKENTGVSDTRNYGIQKAEGKYICFIDADDKLNKDYLIDLVDIVLNSTNVIGCCYFEKFNEEYIDFNKQYDYKKEIYKGIDKFNVLYSKYSGYLWNKIFVKSIIVDNNIKFNKDIYMCEDMLFLFDYLKKVDTVVCINKQNYYYRVTSNGASKNLNDCNWFTIFKVFDYFLSERKEYSEELYYQIVFRYMYYLLQGKYRLKFNKTKNNIKSELEFRIKNIPDFKIKLSTKDKLKLWIYKNFNNIAFRIKLAREI